MDEWGVNIRDNGVKSTHVRKVPWWWKVIVVILIAFAVVGITASAVIAVYIGGQIAEVTQ